MALEMWWGVNNQTLVEEISLKKKRRRTTRTTGVRLPKRTGIFTSLIKHTNFKKYLWALGETADGAFETISSGRA